MTMPIFVFGPTLLEKCEAMRTPGPSRNVPGETEEARDRRRAMDLAHRQSVREVWLQEIHEQYAQSRGWMVSPKPFSLASLYFNARDVESHALHPALKKFEAASMMTVVLRVGRGSAMPDAVLYHVALRAVEVEQACGILKTAGCRVERLPFSFLAPISLHAVLVKRNKVMT